MRDFPLRMTTKRTILRKISLEDAAGWKSFNNAIARRMQWPAVPGIVYARNEILHYLAMWRSKTRYTYIIIERSSGKIIGDFHIKSLLRGRAEFGHALHPSVWGTGITYETLDAVRKAAARRGIVLWAKVEEGNVRSWKSLEKYKATFKGTRNFLVGKERKRMRVYELR
jgi:RimJ/RimL family protein N-acetyltransferase